MAKELTTANGTKVVVEDRYLDDDFCEAAKEYFCKKNKFSMRAMNTYFVAQAVHEYIIDNNLQPVYE